MAKRKGNERKKRGKSVCGKIIFLFRLNNAEIIEWCWLSYYRCLEIFFSLSLTYMGAFHLLSHSLAHFVVAPRVLTKFDGKKCCLWHFFCTDWNYFFFFLVHDYENFQIYVVWNWCLLTHHLDLHCIPHEILLQFVSFSKKSSIFHPSW